MKQSMYAYFGTKQFKIVYLINAPLISVIIGYMLCDPNNVNGQTHRNMILCFKEYAGDIETLEDSEDQEHYHATIKNLFGFSLAVDYVRDGIIFCH